VNWSSATHLRCRISLSSADSIFLDAQFETVHTPDAVWNELTAGEEGLAELWAVRERGAVTVVSVNRSDLYVEIARNLDAGETATITERGLRTCLETDSCPPPRWFPASPTTETTPPFEQRQFYWYYFTTYNIYEYN
jgi:hypothetical protein